MPLKRWLYGIAPPEFMPLEEANILSAMAIAIREVPDWSNSKYLANISNLHSPRNTSKEVFRLG